MPNIILTLIVLTWAISITTVNGGCAELRLCCPGRNMSCIALDTGRPRANALHPDEKTPPATNPQHRGGGIESTSAEARRRTGGRIGGAWHVHLNRGTPVDNFGGSLDMGDRFFESLVGQAAGAATGEAEGEKRSENVRIAAKEDYDDDPMDTTEKSAASGFDSTTYGSADGDYGSGEGDFSSVDWLNSASKETSDGTSSKERITTEDPRKEKKLDHYKIADDDRYELVKEQKEFGDNEQLMIRYVIESDEIPVTMEQLEMLQNYRSLTGGADRSCYCDEACRSLGDCCGDYTTVCPVIDCLVNDWSDWTPCEASADHQKYIAAQEGQNHCGLGVSRRQRRVIREPMHGGIGCPILEEQRTCYGTESQFCREKMMSEVAQLVPYEYGRARVPGYKNNSAGIFYDLPKDIAKFNAGKTHCVTFEVNWLNPACADETVRTQMQVGRRVCAECQVTAQLAAGAQQSGGDARCVGEGADDQRSTWNMIHGVKHCYGFWKPLREEKKGEECRCELQFPNDARFLFA